MDNTIKGVEIDSVREKLIELLITMEDKEGCYIIGTMLARMIADHLTANGVTVATDNNVCDRMSPTADNMSTVQKHGRWISHNKGWNNWVECSECNTVGSPFWKCCPVCEAKMDGDRNA